MSMKSVSIPVTTTGADGSASGNASSPPISGKILALYLNYHASAPGATTDVTVSTEDPVSRTIYSKTDSATDAWIYPRVAVHDNVGTLVTYDGTNEIYEPYPVCGTVKVAIAQSNALTNCVVVHVFYEA